ncbi:MAG: hypothetical protein ACREUE_09765 [Panacagrimonas sp.]
MSLRDKLKVIAAIVAALAIDRLQAAEAELETGFAWVGALAHPALPELSGLASSHRQAGLFWAINDSGNDAALVALDAELRVAAVVPVEAAVNVDWEDLASFEHEGQAWILIADTGDNFALRTESSLLLVPEPTPGAARAGPVRAIRFRYQDGPRDCEAVAVDAPGRRVLLADKGRHPVGLYELSLDAPEGVLQTARRIASFPELVPTAPPRVQTLGGSLGRGTATALDVSADGLRLVVLTYLSASLFERAPGQSWAQALQRPTVSQRVPREPMFEAMAFDAGGHSAVLGTENVPARFYRWTWPH